MTNIELKRLELTYFKGIKELQLEFNHITNIKGDNGTGKSTVGDSWPWLFFGKNMSGESDSKFTLKTTDEFNNVISKVDHSVEAWITVDSQEINIKRVLREKWVKIRGNTETTFKGNETIYFWNDVPLQKKQFDQKVSEILHEDVFKILSDPTAFNRLHWEKQREILVGITGEVNDDDVSNGNASFIEFLEKLSNQKKTIKEYSAELAAKRLKLNNEIKLIPSRIDEQVKSRPDDDDFEGAEKNKLRLEIDIKNVQSKIDNKNTAQIETSKTNQELLDEQFKLKTRNQNIEFEVNQLVKTKQPEDKATPIKNKIESKKDDLLLYKNSLATLNTTLKEKQEELKNVSVSIVQKRENWELENAKELSFEHDDFNCPTCKRPLEASKVESEKNKMLFDFNTDKTTALEKMNREGKLLLEKEENLKVQIQSFDDRITAGTAKIKSTEQVITNLKIELETLNSQTSTTPLNQKQEALEILAENKEYQKNTIKINDLQKQIDEAPKLDLSDLTIQRDSMQAKLKDIEAILLNKFLIEKANERIEELSKRESDYAQQIANLEKQQYVVQEFTNTKMTALENKINRLFSGKVKFKMFQELVDGVKPWCTCLVNGVPWNDVNTAGKVNSGIAIINVLSKYYGVTAPIFVDSRESVTELEPSESQIINLIVSPSHKSLKVI